MEHLKAAYEDAKMKLQELQPQTEGNIKVIRLKNVYDRRIFLTCHFMINCRINLCCFFLTFLISMCWNFLSLSIFLIDFSDVQMAEKLWIEKPSEGEESLREQIRCAINAICEQTEHFVKEIESPFLDNIDDPGE